MKKIITIIVMAVGLMAWDASAQVAKIMVKNGTRCAFYNSDQLATAVDYATEGDSLLLTEGNFQGGVTIDKKLSLIGAGPQTVIAGNVTVKLNGDKNLTSRFADALKIDGNMLIQSSVNGIILRKVDVQSISASSGYEIYGFTFDRCKVENLNGSSTFLKSANAINSYFGYISNDCANINFINCYLLQIGRFEYFKGTATNSIIKDQFNCGLASGCLLTKCLIGAGISTGDAALDECYSASSSDIQSKFDDADALASSGYYGNDGTVVGYLGGLTPYTLEPGGPKVTSMELKVDIPNHKLKITATGASN